MQFYHQLKKYLLVLYWYSILLSATSQDPYITLKRTGLCETKQYLTPGDYCRYELTFYETESDIHAEIYTNNSLDARLCVPEIINSSSLRKNISQSRSKVVYLDTSLIKVPIKKNCFRFKFDRILIDIQTNETVGNNNTLTIVFNVLMLDNVETNETNVTISVDIAFSSLNLTTFDTLILVQMFNVCTVPCVINQNIIFLFKPLPLPYFEIRNNDNNVTTINKWPLILYTDVYTQSESFYSSINIDILMPNVSTVIQRPALSICKAQVHFVGSNIVCFETDMVNNETFGYISYSSRSVRSANKSL
jgi:hypothetical protein